VSAHTSGPWTLDACDWPLIINGDDEVLALVPLPAGCNDKDPWGRRAIANAERIVACVNACEGIADPAALRTERDAMRAALRALFENCAMTHKRWGEGCNRAEADATIQAARALLNDPS
jgi:hypothetical protein